MKKTFKEIMNEPITPQMGCALMLVLFVVLLALLVVGIIIK